MMRLYPKSRPAATLVRSMRSSASSRAPFKLLCGALALGAVVAGPLAPRPAAAQSDEFTPTPWDSAMELFGLKEEKPKPEIDYRERAPLVVPPAAAAEQLPSPQQQAHQSNPNWPKDPDVARRRREAEASNAPVTRDDPGRPLMPSELSKGRKKILGVINQPNTGSPGDSTRDVVSPSELGFSGWASGLGFGQEKPLSFNGEPERETLLQPPAGYQTPAPNAPYGVVEKKNEPFKLPNYFDRQDQQKN